MTVFAEATILVLEHDAGLRGLARRVLAGQAYRVLEVRSGAEAIEIAASELNALDLLICDVDSPNLHARTVATRMQTLRPELRVLFSSGRSDPELLSDGFDIGIDHLLERPFSGARLVAAVRSALRIEAGVALT